jgi:hypothetical protein
MKKLYFSHPISGRKTDIYVNSILDQLNQLDASLVEIINPEDTNLVGASDATVVATDLQAIDRSDIFVIDLMTPTTAEGLDGVGIGSFMELFYAANGCTTIAVANEDVVKGVWLRHHIDWWAVVEPNQPNSLIDLLNRLLYE